jgi:hypothetical protein
VVQARGDAIGGHHIEARGRAQHHAGPAGLFVLRMDGFEHVDFAGDVEVVAALAQARGHHRRGGRGKRPGTVQRDGGAVQRTIERGGVVQRSNPGFTAEIGGQRLDGSLVTPRQDRAQSAPGRFARDQLARVPRGAVDDEPARSHVAGRT